MAGMDTNSSVGLAVVCFFILFIAYLYLESRENDARGNKHFSPQKLGKVLKKTFTICLPDFILLGFANVFICCGFVGNSCMENIHSDEDMRESKKMARLAATLSRSKGGKSSSKKKSKHRKRGGVDDDAEEALFSGDNDSDYSDLENGSVDSGHRRRSSRKSSSKSTSRHTRSEEMDMDMDRSGDNVSHPIVEQRHQSVQQYTGMGLPHARPQGGAGGGEFPSHSPRSPTAGGRQSRSDRRDHLLNHSEHSYSSSSSNSRPHHVASIESSSEGLMGAAPNEEKLARSERRDNRLNLSRHSSSKSKSGVVSRESLQALIAAEDNALGHREASV
jgi:hypothetical protein